MDGAVRNILRRYDLTEGESNPFGLRRPLAVAGARKRAWCGMWQGDNRALVVADSDRPRLLSYVLGDTGWQEQQVFPAIEFPTWHFVDLV